MFSVIQQIDKKILLFLLDTPYCFLYNTAVMKNKWKKWKSSTFSPALSFLIPKESGVYAIVRLRRIMGLPTQLEVLYVGKSNNLRRRFAEHANPWREHNEVLNSITDRDNWEFWYLGLPQKELNTAERDLIRASNPITNFVRCRE